MHTMLRTLAIAGLTLYAGSACNVDRPGPTAVEAKAISDSLPAASLSADGVGGAVAYTAHDLGLLTGGTFSRLNAINSNYVMVGSADYKFNSRTPRTTHAVTRNRGSATFKKLPYPTSGDNLADARDINTAGLVVVQSRVSTKFDIRSWLWVPSGNTGSYTAILPPVAALRVEAEALNHLPVVVGGYSLSTLTRAFRWSLGGGFVDLHPAGYYESKAEDIDGSGNIVGWVRTNAGSYRAFRWRGNNQGQQVLGTLGGGNSRGYAIAHSQEMVGSADVAGNTPHAFRHTVNGAMSDLNLGRAEAFDISELGRIVGWRRVLLSAPFGSSPGALAPTSYIGAFASYNGSSVVLPSVSGPYATRYAYGTNLCGDVVGTSVATDGKTHAVHWHRGIGICD